MWNKSGKDLVKIEQLKQDIGRVLKLEEGTRFDNYENFADAIALFSEKKDEPKKRWEEPVAAEGGNSWDRQNNGRGGYRGNNFNPAMRGAYRGNRGARGGYNQD